MNAILTYQGLKKTLSGKDKKPIDVWFEALEELYERVLTTVQ